MAKQMDSHVKAFKKAGKAVVDNTPVYGKLARRTTSYLAPDQKAKQRAAQLNINPKVMKDAFRILKVKEVIDNTPVYGKLAKKAKKRLI